MLSDTLFQETELDQRRAAISALTGIAVERIHGVKLELDTLRSQGLLIDIEISGTSMFTRKATWMELGILDEDIRRSRLSPGQKYLFPEERVKALNSVESQMRQLLPEYAYRITGFYPWYWMPYTAYQKFTENWAKLQDRLLAIKQDFILNYDHYLELAAADFAQIAAEAWRTLSSQSHGKQLIISIDGAEYASLEAFTDAIVQRAVARFPSRQRIEDELAADYTTEIVYGEQDIAAAELQAARLRQQIQLESAQADAARQEAYLQAHLLERQAQHQDLLQRFDAEEKQVQLNAMRQAETEHARQRLQQIASPFEEVFTTLRHRMAQDAAEMLASIQKNGYIRGQVAKKGRGLLELYQLMAVHDDHELSDRLHALRQAIGPVGDQRTDDSPERDAEAIKSILSQIEDLAHTAAKDLMSGPSRFSLVEF